jgi:hypothetical protein
MESVGPFVERGGHTPLGDHRCRANLDADDYLCCLDLKEQTLGMRE